MSASFWRGKRVLITGHTGFKGAWLSLWLQRLGAAVSGYALPAATTPNLFELADVARGMESRLGDVRDLAAVKSALRDVAPDIVFHLAAQPLVRRSYREPIDTFATNVMGTAHVLEAVRETPSVRVCQIITTDKCYDNREWEYPYRETDALGGHDPYSSSKACAELVAASYRRSFCDSLDASVATARAGNVIGGGDWSEDRLIPDCLRALQAGRPVVLRNPHAVRPWQHVLEPLSGYLWLARRQWDEPRAHAEAWNFGPGDDGVLTVGELVDAFLARWGGGSWIHERGHGAPHEAGLLRLDISKTRTRLGWRPVLDAQSAVALSAAWYAAPLRQARQLCEAQIDDYQAAARRAGVTWAKEALHA